MMPGIEVLKLIEKHQGGAVVVTTMTPMTLWDSFAKRQALHLPVVNSMGKASSIGLGIALARPDRKVLIIDGDGSLLMNLGSLVTIAHMAPRNLVHFVYENDNYGVSGGQPLPGVGKFSFVELALASGYPNALQFEDLEELAIRLPEILETPGPVLVVLKVADTGVKPTVPGRVTKVAYHEVKAALAGSDQRQRG